MTTPTTPADDALVRAVKLKLLAEVCRLEPDVRAREISDSELNDIARAIIPIVRDAERDDVVAGICAPGDLSASANPTNTCWRMMMPDAREIARGLSARPWASMSFSGWRVVSEAGWTDEIETADLGPVFLADRGRQDILLVDYDRHTTETEIRALVETFVLRQALMEGEG